MPIKNNLSKLIRFKNSEESRLGYLRLDKNENIVPFPATLMKKLQKAVTADFVSAYPEVDALYKKLAKYAGCSPDNIYFDNDLVVSVDKISESIRSVKPKLVCIANPNSPTGTVLEPADMEKIIEEAAQINAIVLIDEAYYLFYPKSCERLISRIPNLVITRTFSKAFGLASARLGYGVGHKEMIDCLQKVRPMYETNAYALKFGEILLDHVPLIKKNLKVLQAGKKYLEEQLAAMKLPFFKSYANFVLIDMGTKGRALRAAEFLKSKKILAKTGFDFLPLQRCIRVNIGPKRQMAVLLKALKQFLAQKIIAAENEMVSV